MANVAEGLTVARMATDARQRIAMWGKTALLPSSVIFVLDANGDTSTARSSPALAETDAATRSAASLGRCCSAKGVWLATSRGLWTLTADAPGAAGAEGTLLTPALISPESYTDRGWLRAELDVDLAAARSSKRRSRARRTTPLPAVTGDPRTPSAWVEPRPGADLEPARSSGEDGLRR